MFTTLGAHETPLAPPVFFFFFALQGLLIADECHMVPAPKISELLSSLLGPRRRLVGLTATLPPGSNARNTREREELAGEAPGAPETTEGGAHRNQIRLVHKNGVYFLVNCGESDHFFGGE